MPSSRARRGGRARLPPRRGARRSGSAAQALDRDQREHPTERPHEVADEHCLPLDGRGLEERGQRQVGRPVSDSSRSEQPHRKEGMTPEVEEAVADADRSRRRGRPARSSRAGARAIARLDGGLGRWQTSHRSPARGAPRDPPCRWRRAASARASSNAAGSMYSGKCARGKLPQLARIGTDHRWTRRRRSAPHGRRRPRRATAASRIRGCRVERGLDIAELDAMAADLHLVVEPPQELEPAVGQPADEVAGPVQALLPPRARAAPGTKRSAVRSGRWT